MPLRHGLSLLALGVVLTASPALADDGSGPRVTWGLGVQSDYVLRGVSQTEDRPSAYVSAEASDHGFYAGVWTANVDLGALGDPHARQEVDLYGGFRHAVAGVDLDVGVLRYAYPNAGAGPTPDHTEYYLKASRRFGRLTVGTEGYKTFHYAFGEGSAFYYEANAAYALDRNWTLAAAAGRQDIQHATDYFNWNVGVRRRLTDRLSLEGRWYDMGKVGNTPPPSSHGLIALNASF